MTVRLKTRGDTPNERPSVKPKRIVTYEQYLRLPETTKRYEVIDGEIVMSPAPSFQHQIRLSRLNNVVQQFVQMSHLGIVLFAPFDIVIRRKPSLRTRQPDLAYWSAERIGSAGNKGLLSALNEGLAPDLAVELLSPEESKRRLTGKLEDYATIGVHEVWLIGEQMETVEVLTLTNGKYRRAGLYGTGDMMASVVLSGFSLSVDELFAEK